MAVKPMIKMADPTEDKQKQAVTSVIKASLTVPPVKKIQNTAGADDKEGAEASSGAEQRTAYYSRPKLGTFTDRLLGDAKDAESKLQQAYNSCTTARRELEEAQTAMDTWAKHVQLIRENHMKNGSAQTAEQLKKAQGFALEYLASYNEKKNAYESAYADYEPARKRYGQAVTAYNNYIQNQQDQLSAWKSTIRDTDAIQTDMDALDGQIRETEDEISRLKTLTRGRNDQLGQFMKDSMAQSQVKLEQMKASRAMLQEEYDWSRLSTMGYIDGAESFGSLSADDRLMTMDLLELESWSPEEKKLLQNYVMQSNAEAWGDKRDLMPTLRDARGNADALFRKYGEDKVKAMAESYTRYLNSQNAQLMTDTAIQGANKHGGLHSILSVGANLLNSVSGPLGYMQELGNRTGRYSTLDPNNAGNALGQYAGTVRGQVAQNISGDQYDASGKKIKDGGILRQAGAELYGAGMSAADSLSRLLLGGGNKLISLGLAATGSFGSTVSQMSSQGASPEQAITMGLIDGALEVLTEKLSIDNLFDMASSGKQSIKQILKNMLVQGAVEVSEEEMSFLGSTLAEAVVMREKSGYNQRIQELMAQGNTREQAKEIANRELWQEAGQTAVQSFLSGSMMAGGTSVVTNAQYSQIEKIEKQLEQAREKPESMVLGEDEIEGLSLPQVNVRVETKDRVRQSVIEQAGRLAKATNREIVFYSADRTENGIENGYYEDGTIYVNTRSEDALAQIVSHELTHSVEFADVYQDLSKTVFRQLESRGANIQNLRQQKADLYAQNGHALKDTAAVDKEIVADFVGQYLLADEQTILSVAAQNRTVGQKIKNWLDGMLAKLGNSKAQERVQLTHARDLWAKALEQTKPGNAPVGQNETVNQNRQMAPAEYTASDDTGGDGAQETLEWARGEYAAGRMTEEEFDSLLEMVMQQEEMEGGSSFSFAGVNAKNANFQTLGMAQEMERLGVADETIRKQTGWFKGMDGKWRFEIDDSGMKFHKMGDAQFSKDHEGYQRYRELERKFIDATITDEELSEMAELRSTWANEAPRLRQMVVRGNAKLRHVLDHDALFEQYPQLQDTGIRFGDTDDAGGWWDQERNEIVISNRYRHADPTFLEGILLHEIQHAIQSIEGFANGANPEYWENIQNGNNPVRENDARIARAEREAQDALKGIPPEVAKDFWYAANMRDADPEGAERLENELVEGEYSDAYSDYSWAIWTLQDLLEQDNPKRTAKDLYNNTAGEIEARDTVNRQSLDAEARKKRPPATGDERTVFVENGNFFKMNTDLMNENALEDELRKVMREAESFDGRYINMGKFSERFAELVAGHLELRDIPVVMNYRDAYLAMESKENGRYQGQGINYHNLGIRGMMEAIQGLNEPVAIIQSKKDGKIELALNGFDSKGNGLLAIVAVNTVKQNAGVFAEVHVVTSVYGRRNIDRYIEKAEAEGRGIYKKKEEPTQGIPQVRYEGDINAGSSASSVPDSGQDVKQYSISGTGEETAEKTGEQTTEKKTAQQIREEMPAKARNHLAGAERNLLKALGRELGVSKFQNRENLQQIVREISDEYLTEGYISEEKLDFLFDRGYAEGIVEDARFYEEYKEIKRHLQTTGVTISKQDQADIADYNDFRKRAWGTVRIVNDGLPVDSAYHELHEMAPNLFPESITHPADQLVRMYEVGQSIRVAEVSLQQYYGKDSKNFRQDAKNKFGEEINSHLAELRSVKRVAEEAAEKAAAKAEVPTTPEEAKEAYQQLKDARRIYEKTLARNLLSDRDEIQVGRLLKGEILPEHLDPDKDNVRAITAVYEAKKEYERLTKLIAQYKKQVRSERLQRADALLETANEWKDKRVGLAYSRETMERNIYDIVPDKAVAEQVNREIFHPVHTAEAASTRFKNDYRDRVRKLELSRKIRKGNLVSEAHAVQLLGEAEDNIRVLQASKGRMKQRDGKTLEEWRAVVDDMWQQSPGLDEGKIRRAVEEFRKIYDELFQQMNEVRVRNGYEPVNYRQGYFPHFQPGDGDGVLSHFGKVLGIDTQVAALPTTINGLTHTFRPGIQWFGNAQERLGFNTAYDAVEGFDKYIEGVSSVIHQTDNIQMLRAMESQIRYRTTDEGIRKQVDAVNADDRLTEEEKRVKINDIYEHGKYTLSNFVTELTEYTNLLANKKSRLDRTTEALIGRRAYTIMKNWESRVGANMIAGNISSALTNFIPLTQAGSQLSSNSMLKGMWNTLKAMKEDDGFAGMSTFLTNRRGSDPLVQTWAQTASEKLGLNFLMNLVDGFTSDSIVRAAYYENLRQGMSEAEAMYQADIFASNVMADRSKGAMPTLFESTNPLFKMFTQFQLEVNNQYSEVFKDLPRRHKQKGLLVMAGVLFKYFLGAYLFNDLYEYVAGRRPALDPFGILNDTVGDLTGYELPNTVDWITGKDTEFTTEKVGLGEAAKTFASTALGELPFSSGLTLLGIETDGGRVPASSAIPDLTALWDAATREGWSPEKRWKEAQDELNKLAYIIPPFGGNQVQKVWKAIKAYKAGGSYNVDAEGNDILQYPVYKDDPMEAFANALRMMVMGKSSLETAQDWVESGFDSLGKDQTAVYQDMVDAGATGRESYELLMELQHVKKTDENSKAELQREILQGSNVQEDAKAVVYYGLLASESDCELMDSLTDMGAKPYEVAKVLMAISDAGKLKGAEASCAKRDAIASADLTDEEKQAIYREKISETRDADIAQLRSVGIDFDEFLKIHNEYVKINALDKYSSGKATDFARWVDKQKYTDRQAEAVKDCFVYFSQIPASASTYEKFVDAGLDPNDAYELTGNLDDLEPREGEDKVDNIQRWRECIKFSDNVGIQLAALRGAADDTQYAKIQMAYDFGVNPDSYVSLQEIKSQHDADGNGSFTNAEMKAAVDSLPGLTTEQRAVLWQLGTGNTSAKNNPYSREVGQQIVDARAAAKEGKK